MADHSEVRRDAEQLIRELSAFAEGLPLTMNQDEAGSFSLVVDALLAESASVPALVEALRRIIALPVPRAVHAIEIADQALTVYEQSHGVNDG